MSQPNKKTILLVEDEAIFREFTKIVLEENGYHVLEADDGKMALEIVRNHDTKIDLLITDLMMPRMNGIELSDAIKKLCTNLSVIYMSGYPIDMIRKMGIPVDSPFFLSKPFEIEELLEIIK